MPVYEYTALDAKGKTTSGIIDADGARAARQKLRATGIFPVAIKESQEAPVKKESRTLGLSRFLTRVKPAEIAIMTRQLATLISAGFPLVSAIDALVPQTKSHRLKTILAQVKDAIVEGQNFAQALRRYWPRLKMPLLKAKILRRHYRNIREFFPPCLSTWSAPARLPVHSKLCSNVWQTLPKKRRIYLIEFRLPWHIPSSCVSLVPWCCLCF
jgi:hypothetical protein